MRCVACGVYLRWGVYMYGGLGERAEGGFKFA